MSTFSERHGFVPEEPEIQIREDAPEGLRVTILQLATSAGLNPQRLRAVVCQVLGVFPDPNNWSYLNIWQEVEGLLQRCEWPYVYDLAEAIYADLKRNHPSNAGSFQEDLNKYLHKTGIGWQLLDGRIEVRGDVGFESAVRGAIEELGLTGKPTAANEIREALADLSRRPEPDLTGAIQHSMAALECVAREVSGEATLTLGAILQRSPGLIPPPLDTAIEKAWGYASQRGRHLVEGKEPGHEEAELIVGIAASLTVYLVRKLKASR